MGEGFIEIKDEQEHAYGSGYSGSRAVRTWQERMRILEKLGFIKVKQVQNRTYGCVLLVHPAAVIEALVESGKINKTWLDTYAIRQIETKETTLEQRRKSREGTAKVIPLKGARPAQKRSSSAAP